jgi:putative heme iron utilization protein
MIGVTAALLIAVPVTSGPPQCASAEHASIVRQLYEALPSAPPIVAGRHLQLPEAVVLAGIDPSMAHGVDGTHFQTIWHSVSHWPRGFFIFNQHGWIIKFDAAIPRFLGNQRRDEFVDVVSPDSSGLISHFRPDLVTAIYAVTLPGGLGRDGRDRTGATRAIIFVDDSNESVFGVYASIAGEELPTDAIEGFAATEALIRTLPSLCSANT